MTLLNIHLKATSSIIIQDAFFSNSQILAHYNFSMAAKQTQAAIAMRKRIEAKTRIWDVWNARSQIVCDVAKKTTNDSIEATFSGLVWEEEFTVARCGTQVNI